MRQHVKQAALTFALALPLVLTTVLAGPFSATTAAQAGQRMVGPQFPILIDTNGDGRPGPGDTAANPQPLNNTTLQLTTLFSCNNQNNTRVGLTSQDSAGKYRTASRSNSFREQSMNIAGFSGGGASAFSYTELDPRGIRAQGGGVLVDTNGDGAMDGMTVGGNINTMLTLVFQPDQSYASIPVSQANILGARGGTCGPSSVPQVWVPLADTNGDGRGDRVVLDLDGNGIADPQYYSSAVLGAPGVPTLNTFGRSVLILLLGGIGVWYLGRRQLGEAGPAA